MSSIATDLRPGQCLHVVVENRGGGCLDGLVLAGDEVEAFRVRHTHAGTHEEFIVGLGGAVDRVMMANEQDRYCTCERFAAGACCVHLRLADQLRADGHV